MSQLTVYKASAGSGKTFTLATEYIKLLIENPMSYRGILCVTFTNKATEEMKMRILSQLYGLAHGLDSSASYLEKICKDTQWDEIYVRTRAGLALHNLLHDYSYFRVETIDSFFQSVLRHLACELDLTANLRIELNDIQVEELAVDQMIENLTGNDVVLSWLMQYITDTIGDDKSWNVIGAIKQFGKNIFRDFYKEHRDQLSAIESEPDFFARYVRKLRAMREAALKEVQGIGEEFMRELKAEGFDVADLSNGASGVAGIFLKAIRGEFDSKVVGKRVTDALDTPEKWYTKKAERREDLKRLVTEKLNPLLHRLIDARPQLYTTYKSVEATLANINQVRLLTRIEQTVRRLNEESNRFLLSDTQELLRIFIKDTDAPFVFEKIGSHLEHIMIDEFQDTSEVQWNNFKVLLQETMSHTQESKLTHNLIVGDVKQSIYRFRNGKWELLANIKKEFQTENATVEEIGLDTNFRSSKAVIEFNNNFFEQAAKALGVEAYNGNVEQKVDSHNPQDGRVEVRLLPKADYDATTLTTVRDHIKRLISDGAKPEDIAILLRHRREATLIATYLSDELPDVEIVSDEAFRLDASTAVNAIVTAMRLIVNQDDEVAKATLLRLTDSTTPLHDKTAGKQTIAAITDKADELARMPLYNLAERLYDLLNLNRLAGQEAYLFAFFDAAAKFVKDNNAALPQFIDAWDESLSAEKVLSTEQSGIRILTIHKSKGLEFKHVILPYCDWRIEHASVVWCEPQVAPFGDLPIAAINYSRKNMMETIYEADYLKEYEQVVIDNLNTLYVAFTRARQTLFVIGQRDKSGSRSEIIQQLLFPNDNSSKDTPLTYVYELSAEQPSEHKAKKAEQNIMLQKPEVIGVAIEQTVARATFLQSNESRRFSLPEEEQTDGQPRFMEIGAVMHAVLSDIATSADLDRALQRLESDGLLSDSEISRSRLEKLLRKRLADPRVAEWFSTDSHWTLFNECNILATDEATGKSCQYRPDRVMTRGDSAIVVDFKFGTMRRDYHEQVTNYMQLLRKMGYRQVEGYLWMLYTGQIVNVDDAC